MSSVAVRLTLILFGKCATVLSFVASNSKSITVDNDFFLVQQQSTLNMLSFNKRINIFVCYFDLL